MIIMETLVWHCKSLVQILIEYRQNFVWIKADKKNSNFPTQFYLGSIYEIDAI